MKDVAWLDRLEVLARETAQANGVELFEFEHRMAGKRWWVRLTLDRLDGPVTLGDCQAVSKDLAARLDVEDIVPHAYDLEVSSPGLERPLRSAGDYTRFAGQAAKLVLSGTGEEAGGAVEGILRGAEGETVMLESDGRVEHIPLSRVKKANLVFQFPQRGEKRR